MASTAITASMQRAHSTHATKKQQPNTRPAVSCVTKQATHLVSLNTGGRQGFTAAEKQGKPALHIHKSEDADDKAEDGMDPETNVKFFDERWKNGTWDLNMFVKDGKMDWDGVIVAEAKRRKCLEVYPEAATNQDPVLFRSSIIQWWAWIMHSHLPEAELFNGRAAMIGFFMAYFMDVLTGLDIVGQTGNFIGKAALLVTVMGVVLFRRTQDLGKLRKLADEATFYDKQWQASWQDRDANNGTSNQG